MALPRAFSLQDASLLSGIEPLPLSSPPSPHHSIPDLSPSSSLRRAASSRVTAQLYASLRRSCELDKEAEESRGAPGPPSAAEQVPDQGSLMASEVDDLAEEMSRKLQEGLHTSGRTEASACISQMESLRCHLKNMLTLGNFMGSHDDLPDKALEQQSDCTSTLLSARPMQDLSPPLSLTGLEGLFPRYSTLYNAAPALPDLQLRDTLEKETARRKHLERHIQNLQNEMLELQQRLSLALTADRRKDAMIQQLDQTLAMVVGGWKQQERQKEEVLHRLKLEKEEAERARSKEQEALSQVQQELAEVLESLEREKKAADERQIELQREVDEQAAQVAQLQAKLADEEGARAEERKEMESLHYRMQEQQQAWNKRESELQEEYQRAQEEGRRELEKALTQQEIQKSQQFQLALSSVQSDFLRLERELQTSHRERDALHMELNLEKARNESEKVRIESEHKMRLEEEITERLAAAHEESAQHLSSIREQHRRQLLDLTSQHETELSNQLSQFKSELQERERRHREAAMDYELKLSSSEERCQQLSRSLRRLETERAEMLNQLQDVMKSHWSQALRVLSAKAPTDVLSPLAPSKQTDLTEPWSLKNARGSSYDEETSDQAKKGIMEASNLTGSSKELNTFTLPASTAHRPIQDNDSGNLFGGSNVLNNSQPMEESNRASHRSSSSRQSVNSNSNKFSQLMNERDQLSIARDQATDHSHRYMGEGSHFSNRAALEHISGAQSFLGINQENMGPATNVAATVDNVDVRSLFNSGYSESKSQGLPRQTHLEQVINPTFAHSLMAGSMEAIQRDLKGLNITSAILNQPIQFHNGSNPNLVRVPQALTTIHPSTVGHTSFSSAGSSQVNNADSHSLNLDHSQHSLVKDQTGSQSQFSHIHPKYSIDKAVSEVSHLKEIRNFIAQMSHLESGDPISLFSPTSKGPLQGTNREIRIHPAFREESSSGPQPSHKMTEQEESFYPMQMEELSHSFSSHHGFFPLESHLDSTVTGNGSASLPQMSPEHPFQEEHQLNTTELPPNWRADADQITPNPLLQYYIRMLLDRTPGDPLNELEKESSHVNRDVAELCQYLQAKENQPPFRSEENPSNVSKPHTIPKKQPENKAPEAVKKEVLTNHRNQTVSKPLKRVSTRGGRSKIWK
ncbi:centrobin [Gastrophryne carolinensis]